MDSDTMTATTEQWMQFYQQPLMDESMVPPKEGFSDATVMITKSQTIPSEGKLSPTTSSYTTTSGHFKPIRRRSRASKRTPTTLLNANTTNFRALVQQFTGCPTTAMSSLGVHKGPITLNFKHGSRQLQAHHHNTTTRIMPQIGRVSHNQVHDQVAAPFPIWQKQLPEEQLLHQQQQLMFQEQQQGGNYSFDYMKSSNSLPTVGSSRPTMEVSDGLLVGNDFSFHDLTVNTFSNDAY